jgi:TolB protein
MMRLLPLLALALVASPVAAQDIDPPEVVGGSVRTAQTVAVPVLPTQAADPSLGAQVAGVIAADLRSTGAFAPIGPEGLPQVSFPQGLNPDFPTWRTAGAAQLVTGYVQGGPAGSLTLACTLFDVISGRELVRQGYAVSAGNWRRAAHKCADAVYTKLTGEQPFLDTRVVFVAESGPQTRRLKRIAIMDSDGSNLRYLTEGEATVVTPRFSPDGSRLAYLSYQGRRGRVWVMDLATGTKRLLVHSLAQTSAPRFSPDGRRIAFAMSADGNTDIFIANADGSGAPVRLTTSPGIDTAPDFSPDGSRIVFESDRSGTQQLYVMNADGSNERRISSGGPSASPAWSPRGDKIAFVRVGAFRVGVMNPDGSGERLLTNGWQDESPSWAPNGQFVMFNRFSRAGTTSLYAVPLNGGSARRLPTPQDGSDPSWSPLQR